MDKGEFDATWATGIAAYQKIGNFGNVEQGATCHGVYGTSWGGYVLIETDSPAAFAAYQTFHYNTYAHQFAITFEPLVDMGEAFSASST